MSSPTTKAGNRLAWATTAHRGCQGAVGEFYEKGSSHFVTGGMTFAASTLRAWSSATSSKHQRHRQQAHAQLLAILGKYTFASTPSARGGRQGQRLEGLRGDPQHAGKRFTAGYSYQCIRPAASTLCTRSSRTIRPAPTSWAAARRAAARRVRLDSGAPGPARLVLGGFQLPGPTESRSSPKRDGQGLEPRQSPAAPFLPDGLHRPAPIDADLLGFCALIRLLRHAVHRGRGSPSNAFPVRDIARVRGGSRWRSAPTGLRRPRAGARRPARHHLRESDVVWESSGDRGARDEIHLMPGAKLFLRLSNEKKLR